MLDPNMLSFLAADPEPGREQPTTARRTSTEGPRSHQARRATFAGGLDASEELRRTAAVLMRAAILVARQAGGARGEETARRVERVAGELARRIKEDEEWERATIEASRVRRGAPKTSRLFEQDGSTPE